MGSLKVGVAEADITPEPGLTMWGFIAREGPGTGARDTLHARAFVFRDDATTVGLVALDLGRPPTRDHREAIRNAAQAWGIDDVILLATHTHHAPSVELPNTPYGQRIASQIGAALKAAADRLRPATMRIARASVPTIGHNRRSVGPDGRCTMVWRTHDAADRGLTDSEATWIVFEDAQGGAIGSLVHFACHPVFMGPGNRQYSADYPGVATARIAEATGAPCAFVQGACGDINPLMEVDADGNPADGPDVMRRAGERLAEAVLASGPGAVASSDGAAVRFTRRELRVGFRRNYRDPVHYQAFVDENPYFQITLDAALASADGDDAAFPVDISVLMLENAAAFICTPAEVFVQYQLDLKTRTPIDAALLCGYANGYAGYFPTVRDACAGGYGGDQGSIVELGAADRLCAEALTTAARMRFNEV